MSISVWIGCVVLVTMGALFHFFQDDSDREALLPAFRYIGKYLLSWWLIGLLLAAAITAMYSADYIGAATMFCVGIALLSIKCFLSEETKQHPERKAIRSLLLLLSALLLAGTLSWDRHVYSERRIAEAPCPAFSLAFKQEQIDDGIGPYPFRTKVTVFPKGVDVRTLRVIKFFGTGKITGGEGLGIAVNPNSSDPNAAGIDIRIGSLGIVPRGNSVAELWLADSERFARADAVIVDLIGPERFSIKCVQQPTLGNP